MSLAVVKCLSAPGIKRMKKRITKILKDCGLKIIIKEDLRIVNFLEGHLICTKILMSHIESRITNLSTSM